MLYILIIYVYIFHIYNYYMDDKRLCFLCTNDSIVLVGSLGKYYFIVIIDKLHHGYYELVVRVDGVSLVRSQKL
ncbi:hypothetical protein L2E82_07896 [Cichorium intybus]|uniref:Uncharacterized protein n=1 Tax=Cichorium intybus TaxID=13427 RepID=A0ACB9G538_CICIN|nr:hypothetical protein L2E82_07896 [Cichorium intybus]